jgi:transcriptional regulator GlxA family with amidase domain
MEKRVALVVVDGFVDSGLSVAMDVLRAANALVAREGKAPVFRIDVVSPCEGRVRAASGHELAPTKTLAALRRADVVVVPGLWLEGAEQVDRTLTREDVKKVVRAVATAHERGALVGASCSGVFVLAQAGILDGRKATTTWWLAHHLKRRWPAVDVNTAQALVVDGRILCAGAVFAQADLALHLVSRFAGPAVARRCSSYLLLDPHASQTPYMTMQQIAANEPTVRRAEAWVRAHLAERFDVAAVARHIGTSPRTLARRLKAAAGLSVIGFVQKVRVEVATHLLETSRLSLDEITARVGYDDPSTLRRLIERETNASPRELRERKQGASAARRAHVTEDHTEPLIVD